MSEPADPTTPAPSAPSEEEAWSLVLAAWGDEAAHRADQGRVTDLDGLAVAGGRYRAVLAERSQDPMALRMRQEVLRKATLVGLASLPRTAASGAPRWVRRVLMLALLLGAIFAIGLAAAVIYRFVGAAS